MKNIRRNNCFNILFFLLHMFPFCNIWWIFKNIWSQVFFIQACHIGKTVIFIYVQKPSSSLIYDNNNNKKLQNIFSLEFHKTYFFRTKCSFAAETKTILVFWQYHVKFEGCSVPEHPDIIEASKNLREKLLSELRQCSFTSP